MPIKLLLVSVLLVVLISLACTRAGLGVNFTGWAGPVVVDDSVYLASKKGSPRASIRGFSAFNGVEQSIRFDAGGEPLAIYGTPLVPPGSDMLFTTSVYESGGNERGRVYAVKLNDLGNIVWQFPRQGQDIMGPLFGGVAFSRATNTVYVGSADGKLYALDASDGSPKGRGGVVLFDADSPIWGTPVVDQGTIYFGTMGGSLIGVNEGGGRAFEVKVGGAIAATPVVDDGIVYVGAFDKKFYAIVPGVQKPKWTFPAGNWFWCKAVLAQDARVGKIIYAGSLDGKVYALDANSGRMIWSFQTGQGIRGAPVLASRTSGLGQFGSLTDQVLVVGSRDEKVYGLDPISGDPVWSEPFDAGGRVLAPLIADGNVVFGANVDHDLFALDAATGRLLAGWAAALQSQ
ncbi:MAG: PQQ-binding-like beta-propeller repeat protein [Dehalococcoidia bacterium]